jgi:glycosyltransferase involved in cell wall biosynthesis
MGTDAHLAGGVMTNCSDQLSIVHVVESLDVGGLERVVLSLAAWQLAQGHASRIICLFHEGALANEARGLGIEVVAVGKKRGLDLRALQFLRQQLRTEHQKTGNVVLHTHNPAAHYYGVAAALGLGMARIINTRHGMGAQGSSQLDFLYRLAMLNTDKGVAVCRAGRDRFVQTGVISAAKAVVVPNGAAVEVIATRNSQAKQRLLAELGRPSTSVVLGTVGRLSAVKDQASLLHALAQLRNVMRDAVADTLPGAELDATDESIFCATSGFDRAVELVIIGDGELRAKLETLAQDLSISHCVHFMGMRSDVAQLLAALDVFVLSSLSEGYSLAMVEAAAAALPIVATKVGGNADIVEEGANGLLVPPKDVQLLTQAMAMLVDDTALRERMGHASRQWALNFGGIASMGRAYSALYQSNTPSNHTGTP